MRPPRSIAELMVALAAPRPADVLYDPAAGDCELLAAAAEFLRSSFPAMARDREELEHFSERMFHACGADSMGAGADRLRTLGIASSHLAGSDALERRPGGEDARFTLVLSRLPCGTRREARTMPKGILRDARTRRLELAYLAHALERLATGGRAVLIVPDHLLSGETQTHRRLRALLVEEQNVQAVIALPRSPSAAEPGDPASILLFTRTDCGGTGRVWFCDADAIVMASPETREAGSEEGDAALSRSPDSGAESRGGYSEVIARWQRLDPAASGPEPERARDAESFCVPKSEIALQGYDLGVGRYRLPAPARIETRRPQEILAELAGLEAEIFQGMKDLVGMLK